MQGHGFNLQSSALQKKNHPGPPFTSYHLEAISSLTHQLYYYLCCVLNLLSYVQLFAGRIDFYQGRKETKHNGDQPTEIQTIKAVT
jgi:hypothetical protein